MTADSVSEALPPIKLAQPVAKWCELSALDQLPQPWNVVADAFPELGGDDVAERIRREVAERTGRPPAEIADALQASDLDDPELRTDAAGQAGSRVAALPEVRANLLNFQKKFAYQASGAVLDGRDIGTVICPDAPIKLFVTASPEARAERRYRELRARGLDTIKPRVLAEMAERDRRDSERAAAPLKAAPDAYLLDTSDMDADTVFAAALAFIARKGFRSAGP